MKNLIILLALLLMSCNSKDSDEPTTDWLIPSGQVQDGGPGKDGIPSVDDPNFSSVSEITFLASNDLVVGIVQDGIARAYPHNILDWHEIVNDEISDTHFALTYCPLTGTAVAWDRNINGNITTFGVSGKLYNSNLLPYDRATDSYWSQIRLDCVHGDLIETKIGTFPIIETTWATWKAAYPDSEIQNTDTGFSRNYTQYPYGDYRTNHNNLIFPVNPLDERLPSKERVLGILSDNTNRVYPLNLFGDGRVIEDEIDGVEVIVIGSKQITISLVLKKATWLI